MSRFGRMWRANNLLFVVLCLTKLTSGDKIIDERLSIFQKIDKFVSGDPTPKGITNVKIMGGDGIQKEFRIYMYSSPSNLEFDNFPGLIDDYTDKKSMMLYICISCVFAEWVENQLIELVKRIPSMYKTVKTDENDVLWNISELKEHFEYIRKMTKRFINILFNFINVHSYNTVSSLVDMSLLRLLVSKILINYLSMDTTPEVNIVTNILKIVNEAQTFLAFNCDVVSSYYDNKYFFSYSMTKTKTDKNHIDIDDFLNILTTFNLETPLEQCSAKQMLLGNIFSSENAVSTELRHNVELRVMKKKVKIDKDLFMKINQSVDLDVIYWYTNIILDVIIRIFCMKTSYYLDENTIFDQKIIEGFQKLSFFFTELTIDSEEVIEGFNFLASNQEITMAKRKELTKLMTNYFERSSENRGPENDSSQWFPSFAIKVDEQATDDNLDTFMDLIMNQIFDYKCFINIFNLLTIEHKQNYLSQRRDPSKVYEFVYDNILEKTEVTSDFNDPFRQVSIDNSMCKLVINMYEYCVEYCVTLIWDQNSPEEKTEENKEEVSEIIYGMLEALNHIYDKRMIRDRFQFELLLNIMPILEIKRRQITNFESQNNIELIRFLYIIMIELNKYGLEACTRDKDENLFFNRINYDTMGVHPNKSETIKDKLIKFIPVINEPIIVGTLPNLNYWLENMKTFCFNKSIQLYWRGEHKTFNQIYDSLIHHIWSPHYVYELYDVYFKFEMAQLFYEANRLIHNMRGNIVSSRSFFSNIMIRVDRIFMDFTTIPTEFTMALKKFTIEGLGHTLRCDYDRFPFDEFYTTVENILKKLGINIVKELPCSDSTPTYRKVAPEPINPEERKKKIKNDLNEYLVHTSKTIEMIKIAEAEYLKFKNLYNHINVQYNFRK